MSVYLSLKNKRGGQKKHSTKIKKCKRQSLKNLFVTVRPWIGQSAVGTKKSQPKIGRKKLPGLADA
jgi:hypothetical protein